MMRLLLFGPPGVGKGTQAKLLSAEYDVPHVSTGDILRAAIAEGTEIGKKAKATMEAGHLVPDEIMIGIVREVLSSPATAHGFILDGFPRTLAQAQALSGLFDELMITDYTVINLGVEDEVVIRRLSHRLTCEKDGKIYNMETDSISTAIPCPDCGGRLIQREDDKEETVRRRLTVYESTTAPVLRYYAQRQTLVNIDGMASVDEVNRRIKESIRA